MPSPLVGGTGMLAIRIVTLLAMLLPGALFSASATQAADSAVTTSGSADRPAAARVVKYCKGKKVTIWGGKGRQQLVGTSDRDVIHGGPGSDSVSGASGRDLLCGGPGADLLDGGAGADRLYGNKDVDACFGEDDEHVNHFGARLTSLPFPRTKGPPRLRVSMPLPPRPRRLLRPGLDRPRARSRSTRRRGAPQARLATSRP